MAHQRRVAVIEAGPPDTDSLASVFILLGYGRLTVSSPFTITDMR